MVRVSQNEAVGSHPREVVAPGVCGQVYAMPGLFGLANLLRGVDRIIAV